MDKANQLLKCVHWCLRKRNKYYSCALQEHITANILFPLSPTKKKITSLGCHSMETSAISTIKVDCSGSPTLSICYSGCIFWQTASRPSLDIVFPLVFSSTSCLPAFNFTINYGFYKHVIYFNVAKIFYLYCYCIHQLSFYFQCLNWFYINKIWHTLLYISHF